MSATNTNTPVAILPSDSILGGSAKVPKVQSAYAVLVSAHSETPVAGGLSAKAAWDTLAAFGERIGAKFPTEYREDVLRAASLSSVKQKGATRTGRISLTEAWKSALAHSEADGIKDEGMRAARDMFTRIARIHAAFGSVDE
jgi:hypothetical protein